MLTPKALCRFALSCFALFLWSNVALAQDAPDAEATPEEAAPEDDGHLELKAIGYLSLGPTLGAVITRLSHKDVYGHSDNRLMDGLYWQAGMEVAASPGTLGMKLFAEWVPVAVLKLHASYAAVSYLGTPLGLGHSLTFADADSPYDKAALKDRAGEEVAHLAHRGTFTLTLRAQIDLFIFFSVSGSVHSTLHFRGDSE